MDKKKIILIVGIIAFIGVLGGIAAIYYHSFNVNKEELEEEASHVGIVQVTGKNFNEEVLNSDKTVVLEFSSKMCLPCVSMLPTLINIAKNHEDVKVATIDIDEETSQNLANRYNISGTPTIIIFKNEQVQKVLTGAVPEETITKELNS